VLATLIGVVVITIWPLVAVHCSVTTGVAGAIVSQIVLGLLFHYKSGILRCCVLISSVVVAVSLVKVVAGMSGKSFLVFKFVNNTICTALCGSNTFKTNIFLY
jgi:hypothetical protein